MRLVVLLLRLAGVSDGLRAPGAVCDALAHSECAEPVQATAPHHEQVGVARRIHEGVYRVTRIAFQPVVPWKVVERGRLAASRENRANRRAEAPPSESATAAASPAVVEPSKPRMTV
jgi:hypothetical protein